LADTKSLAMYFPDIDERELADLGLPFAFVSVFERWLSEEECASSRTMTYSIALEAGEIEGYLEGERKFFDLYRALGKVGMIVGWPQPIRRVEVETAEFEGILRDSLREQNLMDVYFEGYGVRIRGGYDRTDVIIADSVEQLSTLELEVRRSGLFMLR
jgi:hypothetical protein